MARLTLQTADAIGEEKRPNTHISTVVFVTQKQSITCTQRVHQQCRRHSRIANNSLIERLQEVESLVQCEYKTDYSNTTQRYEE